MNPIAFMAARYENTFTFGSLRSSSKACAYGHSELPQTEVTFSVIQMLLIDNALANFSHVVTQGRILLNAYVANGYISQKTGERAGRIVSRFRDFGKTL
jgi:hypothetical protein